MLFVIRQFCFSPDTGVSPTPLPIFPTQFFYTGSAVSSISLAKLSTCLPRIEIDSAKTRLVEPDQALEKLSTTDQLTNLSNRRGMVAYLRQEWTRTSREQNTLALLICAVDHLRSYNAHYGHQAGDSILRRLAAEFEHAVRRRAGRVAR